jgi:hypothetical protein
MVIITLISKIMVKIRKVVWSLASKEGRINVRSDRELTQHCARRYTGHPYHRYTMRWKSTTSSSKTCNPDE